MRVDQHPLGTLIETDSVIGLFGNRNSQLLKLQESFPGINFKRIKQVHGDRVVHTSPHTIDFSNEADSHYSSEKKLGLCVSTADCGPVLILSSNPFWIASIHAGWRGVEKRIVPKTISVLLRNGCLADQLRILVGPHIQKPSFEVGNDVRDLLLKSFQGEKDLVWEAVSGQKSRVDLQQILKFQLSESGINLENCFFEMKDTVTDPDYHSYRRDRDNSGRQLSFIAFK